MIISDGRKIKVYNGTVDTIPANKVVIVKGKNIVLASNDDSECFNYPLAYTLTSIDTASYGEVLFEGSILNLNTSGYGTGNVVIYLGTNGALTTSPSGIRIVVANLIKSDSLTGELYFKVFLPASAEWGNITGILSDQTDLQEALDAKTNLEDINPLCKLTQTVTKGQAVYISSANGTNMLLSLASNAAEVSSSKTFGLAAASGVTNDFVRVITSGFLAGLDTSGANAAGDPVWLGVDGQLLYGIANKPYAPAHLVFIGIVTRKNNNNGEIYIRVQNGFEIDELHNVDARNPSNNDGIFYNTSTSLWEHKSIAAVLGYTPYSATNPNGYITSSALSPYLTSAAAALAYQPIINLTTLGTSGAATLIGSTLNIPQYSGGTSSSVSFQTIVGSATGLAAGTTRYGNVAGTTAESQNRLPIPVACTMSDLYVRTTATMGATASLAVTIFKNGSATTVTLLIAGGSAAGTYSYTATTATFAAGDGFNMEYKNVGAAAAAASSGTGYKVTI